MPALTSQHKLVLKGLRRTVGDWPALSAESGIPYHTLAKVANGATQNPSTATVHALFDALVRRLVITGHRPGVVT